MHPCQQSVEGKRLSELTGYHLKNWKADTDEQISYDGTALLGGCDHHSFYGSNLVEATIDAKRACRDCNVEPNLDMGCCG